MIETRTGKRLVGWLESSVTVPMDASDTISNKQNKKQKNFKK